MCLSICSLSFIIYTLLNAVRRLELSGFTQIEKVQNHYPSTFLLLNGLHTLIVVHVGVRESQMTRSEVLTGIAGGYR